MRTNDAHTRARSHHIIALKSTFCQSPAKEHKQPSTLTFCLAFIHWITYWQFMCVILLDTVASYCVSNKKCVSVVRMYLFAHWPQALNTYWQSVGFSFKKSVKSIECTFEFHALRPHYWSCSIHTWFLSLQMKKKKTKQNALLSFTLGIR